MSNLGNNIPMLIVIIASVLGSLTTVWAGPQQPRLPRSSSTHEQLRAAIASCAGDSGDAFDACRRAVRLGLAESGVAVPENELVYERLSRAFVAEARYDEALAMYRVAVRRFRNNADLHYGLGSLLIDRFNAAEEAWGPLREAVRRRPDFAGGLLALGNVECELEYFDEAIRHYRAVLKFLPDSPDALTGLGKALSARGDHLEAIATLEKSVRNSDAGDAAWTALGGALLAGGRAEDAVSALRRAVAINRDAHEAFCVMSQALTALGRLEDARTACRMARRATQHGVYPCACKPE